jgi:O-methyltransferase
MRAILAAYGDRGRRVWAADSFHGLPKPDAARYPADAGDLHWTRIELAVSLDEVKRNFARYGLLDERVCFLEGWFKDTLPAAPIDRLAVLRLDGDLYESTLDALRALYPKLSIGGYAIVDDYGAVAACARAVEDYRREHGISEPIRDIDGIGVYWQRQR